MKTMKYYEAATRVAKVVDSCETEEQLSNAVIYCGIFISKYKPQIHMPSDIVQVVKAPIGDFELYVHCKELKLKNYKNA